MRTKNLPQDNREKQVLFRLKMEEYKKLKAYADSKQKSVSLVAREALESIINAPEV